MKKQAHVNGFQAPEEWYRVVQRIADERHLTIGAAIQYVFNLGLPIYERVKAAEDAAIRDATSPHRDESPHWKRKQGNHP